MGRYLVGKCFLKPGNIIMSEKPIIVGPCQESKAVCLGCYNEIADLHSPYRCKMCNWPMCGPKCSGLHTEYGHSSHECKKLSQIPEDQIPSKPFDGEMYNAIVPLRCLLLETSDPLKWNQLNRMEPHNEIRKSITKIWNYNQLMVVDRIRNKWKFTEYPEDLIHTMCGYLEVNSFAIGQGGLSVRGLYPTCFLISHDCIPNTCHIDDESFKMTIRASTPIEKGETITLAYAQTLQGTLKRREHLKESKFFDCICNRCSDKTEFGTMFSALKCGSCKNGYLLPNNPLNSNSSWICLTDSCKREMKSDDAIAILNRIELEAEKLKNKPIDDIEEFLVRYGKALHSNHYLLLAAKLSLSQMYGKTPGYIIHEMSQDKLQRKLDICEEIMKLIDIMEPGLTRLRGITMYELHAPLMILTMNGFRTNMISQKEFKSRLRKVVQLLEDAYQILSYEPKTSQESMVCQAAKEALISTKGWEKTIGKK